MSTCRLCGIDGLWDWGTPCRFLSYRVVEELCTECYWGYVGFFMHSRGITLLDPDMVVERDESLLTEYVAARLLVLAKRHATGKSIIRCHAIPEPSTERSERCCYFYTEEVDGHKLCTNHAKKAKRHHPMRFANSDNDLMWMDQVTNFFYNNLNLKKDQP